ncbi:unnamed protein product [Fusarium graminearum]|uniref:Uncharacterized protein n=1 Tax=Gibberella zeae TaxID=5518 RepID=A0A4E9DWZ7_GIBZA|nr:hypothetical protein HG531_013598 [Fusarium graminearum]CAG2005760.1 unnamed protein product [Fusarium graminearum]
MSYTSPLTTTIHNRRLRLLNGLRAKSGPIMTFLGLPSFRSAELLASTGLDGIIVDCEHGHISDDAMHALVPTITSQGVSPLVRTRMTHPDLIKRALDAGSHGIIVPMINTVEDAEAVVRNAKFPPGGLRGQGSAFPGFAFGVDIPTYIKTANETILICLASIYRHQGRLKEAEELEMRVIEIRTRTLGEAHLDTLMSMGNLASTYQHQGRWKEAEELGLNLIEAASRSKSTKRFLPSEFEMVYREDNIAHITSYHWKLKAVDALEKTDLEFSLISIGLFLDDWAAPRIPTHIRAVNMFIDPENNAAVIPGDGNSPMVLTHSTDAAKFTVAALDLPHWKRRYSIVANRTTLNDAVRLAEEIKGTKFNVKYFSVEEMEKGEIDLTPSMKKALPTEMHDSMKNILALTGIGLSKGEVDLDKTIDLTLEFSGIKCLTVKDVWEAWK